MANGEPNGKLTYWIMGVLVGLLALLAGTGWHNLKVEIDRLRQRQVIVEERVIGRLQYLERTIERLRSPGRSAPPFEED